MFKNLLLHGKAEEIAGEERRKVPQHHAGLVCDREEGGLVHVEIRETSDGMILPTLKPNQPTPMAKGGEDACMEHFSG